MALLNSQRDLRRSQRSEQMSDSAGKKPQRSCIACRREGDKESFLRFVASPEGTVTPDLESKLPGRGAYTCRSTACLKDALKRRQFNRAFKGASSVSASDALPDLVRRAMEQRIGGYLSLANKAGAVVSGGDGVERALRSPKRPALLVLAQDISPAIADKLQGVAERAAVPVCRALPKELMGQLLGKESDRSAAVILSSGFARSLCKEIERYRKIGRAHV